MNLTLSPQIKILALVGLLAAVGLAASTFVLGGSGKKTSTSGRAHAAATCDEDRGDARVHTQTPAKQATKTHTVSHAKAHKKAKPAGFHGNAVYAQLPKPLQWQLAHHKVVVVSFYNPSSNVDAISVAEAHAGANDAGAGFLLVSVLDNKVAGILTALLPGGGLLPDPGVIIYRAPGDVALRLDGFADRASVAQAATNAIHGETGPALRNLHRCGSSGSRRARSTGDHRRPVTRRTGDDRPRAVRPPRQEGRPFGDDSACRRLRLVVRRRGGGLSPGQQDAVTAGPYTFADAAQATAFVTEAVESLMYLGCDVFAE